MSRVCCENGANQANRDIVRKTAIYSVWSKVMVKTNWRRKFLQTALSTVQSAFSVLRGLTISRRTNDKVSFRKTQNKGLVAHFRPRVPKRSYSLFKSIQKVCFLHLCLRSTASYSFSVILVWRRGKLKPLNIVFHGICFMTNFQAVTICSSVHKPAPNLTPTSPSAHPCTV